MILTPIDTDRLPTLLDAFATSLEGAARDVFSRIADPRAALRATGESALAHHAAACALAESFGMGLLPGSPRLDFSWNGRALRSETEAYVLLHEVAHFQLATPERRCVIDFGLGPGPESGNTDAATAAACVPYLACEAEEARASLLGILWEIEFGQPGLASFLDQNWLEGADRPAAVVHFRNVLDELRRLRLIDGSGRPQRRLAALD